MSKKNGSASEFYLIKQLVLPFLFFFIAQYSYSQNKQEESFQFLNIPVSARQVGLGGSNITSNDRDPTVLFANPGGLTKDVDGYVSFNYTPYFSKVNYLNTCFAKDLNGIGVWGVGINYLDYGTFKGYDPTGEPIGEYSSRDYSLVISNSHSRDNFSFGGSLKLVGSTIAGYSASGIFFDVGGVFNHPNKDLKIGLVIRNVGFAFKKYSSTAGFSMPFDVQLGGSFKPVHMPLRFSITLHHLNQLNVSRQVSDQKISVGDQIFRHFIFGTEVLLSKNINFRAGYNHLRRKELKPVQGGTLDGFSVGLMVRVRAFEFAYSRGIFNPAGSQNTFTLNTDLNYFLNKN